eukprot:TRINITY_DN11272_c0_g1_i1.p1 TRINITY_DN11272_c0_g1~~TRINITY_DN11272_c0_g1_i1.p1  ORF type:complete len:572 (-),score=58.93 TRINITY_DN11272_c0_g1_i1:262-1977(-)
MEFNTQQSRTKKLRKKIERRQVGVVQVSTFLTLFKYIGWISFIIWAFLSLGSEVIKRLLEMWIQSYVKSVNEEDKTEILFLWDDEANTLTVLIVTHISIVIVSSILLATNHLRALKGIFSDFNLKVIYSKMAFFDREPVGRIVNRYSEDMFIADEELNHQLSSFSKGTFVFASMFAGIIVIILWFIPGVFIRVVIIYYYQNRFRQINREIQRVLLANNSNLTDHIAESLKGIRTIRAFKREANFLGEFIKSMTNVIGVEFVSRALYFWVCYRIALIAYLILFTILIICSAAVLFDYRIEYTRVSLSLSYSLITLWLYEGYLTSIANLEKSFISFERINQYLSNETEPINENDNQSQNSFSETDQIITFENVYFLYPNQLHSKESEMNFALQDVSFSIRRGEKVGIYGRSGSGKSSILSVLFRFYDIQKGRILLNGTPINTMSLANLRKQISIIPQLGFLFKGTLRENLDPNNEVDDATILQMVQKIGLSIRAINSASSSETGEQTAKADEVTKGKKNLEFELDNLGSNLSNGEQQMINFLRAFIHAKEIICLDEANSNIDPTTDALMMKLS